MDGRRDVLPRRALGCRRRERGWCPPRLRRCLLRLHTCVVVDRELTRGHEVTQRSRHARVAAADVERALGWELKPEGFCLGPVCYPVPAESELVTDDGVDIAGLANLIESVKQVLKKPSDQISHAVRAPTS